MAKMTQQPQVTTDRVSLNDQPTPVKEVNQTQYFALSADNLFDAYTDADEYTGILNNPFPEFQRVAHALPFPGLPKKYPRIAEGSTGAYIEQKPRDLIQQTPSGDTTCEAIYDEQGNTIDAPTEWIGVVGQWALDNEIIPKATEDYPVFEKAQAALEQAFTVGFTVTTAPFYNHDGVWSPDMTMCYWGDVKVPAGYKSIRSMPYVFLDGWWPKEKVDSILAMDPATAKEAGFDLTAIKESKETLSSKDWKAETPVEKTRGLPQNFYRVSVGYQKGVKAPIFMFNPDTKSIIRAKPNKDPRGNKNIQVLYGKIDGTNPFGVSVLERGVGAWQNLMDNDVQAYQYNRMYNVDPATKRIGNIGDGELAPGASFTAQNETDDISTIELNSEALSEFPTLYEWQKDVLNNRLNSSTTAGSDGDNPHGKTPAGVLATQGEVSTDDQAYINHTHSWFQEWAETVLNLYFAERVGKQSLVLNDETVELLLLLAEDGKFDKSLLTGNSLMFDFDQPLPIIRWKIDASSSKIQSDASQVQIADGLLTQLTSNSELLQLAGPVKVAQLYNKIVALSGMHDSSELELDIDTIKQQVEDQQKAANAPAATQEKPPSEAIAFKDMPGFGQLQMAASAGIKLRPVDVGLNPDMTPMQASDGSSPAANLPVATPTPTGVAQPPANPQVPHEVIKAAMNLKQHGLPEILIPHAIQALTEGVPLEAIKQSIKTTAMHRIKAKVVRK